MILKELSIELGRWGDEKGKYTGKAHFSGKEGDVILNLNQHHIEEIFKVCADSIIETSRAAARHLTCAVIEQSKMLTQESES
jgi:hypothetical protein